MKVFELMQALSKYPAGAEVKFRTMMTLAEFSDQPVEVGEDGKDLYSLDKTIEEVDAVNENLIAIYS